MNDITTLAQTKAVTDRREAVQVLVVSACELLDIPAEQRAPVITHGIDVQRAIDGVAADLELAVELTIDSPEMLDEAQAIAGRLAAVCADSGVIESERKALTKPLNDIVKWLNAGYNAPKEHISSVLGGLREKILAYDREQKRQAAERAEAERRERERQAAEAAERERAAKAEAEKLAREAQQAQESGDAGAAAELAAKAAETIDTARVQATQAAAVLNAPVIATPTTRAKGVRGTWKANVTDKAKLIQHVAARIAEGDLSLVNLLDVNTSAANALAKAQQANLQVPGLAPYEEQSLAVRRAA